MARPTKQGIDYFPVDVEFDDKTQLYILEKEANGLAVLLTIWQLIYSNEGYYISNNPDLPLLIKKRINVSVNEVSDCINACLRRNLFDQEKHKNYSILTSKAIQKRYFGAVSKKKIVQIIDDYIINGIDSGHNWVSVSGNATNVNVDVKEDVDVNEKVKEKEKEYKYSQQTDPDSEQNRIGIKINNIFEHWKFKLNHPRARLDDKRRKQIGKALKLGYSESDLKNAIEGCSLSPYHQGDNENGTKYDSIELIFRNADKIDQFLKYFENPPRPRSKANQRLTENISAAERAMEITNGNKNEY